MAAGTSPPATPSRAELLTCTQPPPAPEERCQQKSQEDSLGCREGNLFRVITYGNALTFPPNYPNTVVPGKYSVQSHRLVIFELGKSHCTVFICYSMPVLFLIHLEITCLLHLLSPHSQDLLVLGLLGFFHGQRLKSILVEKCVRVLPAHEETAQSFTHAEGTDFSALNEANQMT